MEERTEEKLQRGRGWVVARNEQFFLSRQMNSLSQEAIEYFDISVEQ